MTLITDPDRDWELWGRTNPYFGVLTDSKYLRANLNEDAFREFFATGERHIEHVYGVIRAKLRQTFRPFQVLDYGCGVGRLLAPLAKRSRAVVGVDISAAMLEEAKENCKRDGVASVRLLHYDELGVLQPASFDLVHSFIVFQHIPVARGELILRRLLNLIAEGGVGAIHLTYHDSALAARSLLWRSLKSVSRHLELVHGLSNLIRRRPFSTPFMEMNSYNMNRIFNILIDANCSNLHVEFSDHNLMRGAMLYFEKSTSPLSL